MDDFETAFGLPSWVIDLLPVDPTDPTVLGTADDLDQSNLGAITTEDLLQIELARLDGRYLSGRGSLYGIDVDTDGATDARFALTIDPETGILLAVPSLPSEEDATFVTLEDAFPLLTEREAVGEETINGFLSQRYLIGDGLKELVVTFDESNSSVAYYKNKVGVYDIAADGTISNARLLFQDAHEVAVGTEFSLGTPEEGVGIGFFLVQDGARRFGDIDGVISFVNTESGDAAKVTDELPPLFFVDGEEFDTEAIVFHALNPDLNPDGAQHILSGVKPDGLGITIGFEDLLASQSDQDFNDVRLTVQAIYEEGELGGSPSRLADNLTLLPGQPLSLTLSDYFPDLTTADFTLDTGSDLPPALLKDGVLRVLASPTDIGVYEFAVTAAAGDVAQTKRFVLDVVTDPVGTTRVSGTVLNTDEQPLAGVRVTLDGDEAFTDADGNFTVTITDTIEDNALIVHAAELTGGERYPSVAERLPLLYIDLPGVDPGIGIYEGVNNVLDRPIYLPELDVENGTIIDSFANTTVTTPTIPGASVLVTAGSLQDIDGTSFDGVLSITEVPRELTPAALPENLIPDFLVTVQPGEMTFLEPAPLSLPNVGGYEPGEELDLWSINPETGQFDNVGLGRVSSDGTVIETIDGGIRNSSWHFFAPPEPTTVDPIFIPQNPIDTPHGCPVAALPGTSMVELHSGAVIETHDLATYTSLGDTRGLSFVYDSMRANPNAAFWFGIDGAPDDDDARLVADVVLRSGETEFQVPGADAGFGLPAGRHFFDVPDGGGDLRAAVLGELQSLDSGRYDYELTSGLLNFDGTEFSGTTATQEGRVVVVNETDSPFGAGWGIAGLQKLVENPDGSVLLIDGNGGEMIFLADDSGGFEAPPGDFTTFQREPDGTFTRTMKDQTVYRFDQDNLLSTVTDRNGNAVTYEYDDAGRLTKMIDPVGLETVLTYALGLLSTVTDPAGRVAEFDYDAGGNLIRITDPDGTSRSWDYDGRHLMTGETDKRGNVEEMIYDDAGRAERAVLKDGSERQFDPVQSQGVFAVALTSDPLSPPTALLAGPAVTTFTDENGNVTTYTLDGEGQVVAASDDIGALPTYERDELNQLRTYTDAKGNATTFDYDARGNLISALEPLSFQDVTGGAALLIHDANTLNDEDLGFGDLSRDDTQAYLLSRGFSVDLADDVPADLSQYDLVFDIRFTESSALTGADEAAFESYLQGGGDLLLVGENLDFPARNASLISFIEDIGGGDLEDASDDIPFAIVDHVVNPRYDQPNATFDGEITYNAPGGLSEIGNGEIVTSGDNGVSAVRYDPGTLGGALDGRLTVIFDVNTFDGINADFDADRLLDNLFFSVGGSQAYTYDPSFNRLTSYTDELGRETLYEIDATNGNTLSITEVIGGTGGGDDLITAFTYTSDGLIDTVTDPLGRLTDYDYNARGLIASVTFAVGTADQADVVMTYDGSGNLETFTDERGNVTTYAYDALNRLVEIVEADPDGAGPLEAPVTTFSYDAAGNLVATIDAEGSEALNVYDARDRLTEITDALGGVTSFDYDANGNLSAIVDPSGNQTTNSYDERDRLIRTSDARGGETSFAYDLNDNLTSLTDSVANTTSFEYDARDRLIRETDPLGEVTTYAYDVVDNLVSVVDRELREVAYAYDDVDRLIEENWIGDPQVITYAYDKASNLTAVTDLFSALAFTYDARDRITQVSNLGTPGAPEVILDYSYDDAGNRISMVETIDGNQGATTGYDYDALNRMIRIAQDGPGVAEKRVDMNYNGLGQLDELARFSDITGTAPVTTTEYSYDALNRISAIEHLTGGDTIEFYDFAYDPNSRITAITDTSGETSYAYDATDQLIGAQHDDVRLDDESYTYDLNGNRITTATQGTDYVTGPGNRLLEDSRYAYVYDDEGNLIQRIDKVTAALRQFEWDYLNRLVSVSDLDFSDPFSSQTVTFTYDALGRRIAKTVDENIFDATEGATEHYVYDGGDVILEFTEAPGGDPKLTTRNLHGPAVDQILAQEDMATDEVRWLHTDHLGSVNAITDEAGAVVNRITYDSFGNIVDQTDASESSRYAFTGRELDEETGLQFHRARYYDPALGTFINEDIPSVIGIESNKYTYVRNNPLVNVDHGGTLLANAIAPVLVYTLPLIGGALAIQSADSNDDGGSQTRPSPPVDVASSAPIPPDPDDDDDPGEPDVDFPENNSQLDHIFRDKSGHYSFDTHYNRKEILNTVDKRNFAGQDQFGNDVYFRTDHTGSQVWVQVRNGVVQNAGRNAPGGEYALENGVLRQIPQ